jgi:hypothetical protein
MEELKKLTIQSLEKTNGDRETAFQIARSAKRMPR